MSKLLCVSPKDLGFVGAACEPIALVLLIANQRRDARSSLAARQVGSSVAEDSHE
jgi:hypothetical protein